MPSIEIVVHRIVDYDIAECELIDAFGQRHRFLEKICVFSTDLLPSSACPTTGVFDCDVIDEWTDANGRALSRVSTATPWRIESVDGITLFVVPSAQVKKP